jgi:hypothetical protein
MGNIIIIIIIINVVSCHRPFLPGTSLEPPPLRLQASHCSTFHIMCDYYYYLIIALLLWKPSVYVCRIDVSETLDCLMLTTNVETFLLLDALGQQVPIGNTDDMFNGCSISINDFNFLILSLDKFNFNLGILFVTNLVTLCTFLFFFDKKLCCLCNWPYGCCGSTLLIINWIIIICWTRISLVDTLNRLRAERFRVRIPAWAKLLSVLKDVEPAPGPTQTRIHWTTGLLRSKSQGLEADN